MLKKKNQKNKYIKIKFKKKKKINRITIKIS